MEHHETEHTYSDVPQHPEMIKVKDIAGEPRRLRDRDLLKKRKAEAEEKETYQELYKSKRQRKGRTGGKRGGKSHHKEEEEEEPEEEVVEKEPEVPQKAPSSEREPKTEEVEHVLISDDDDLSGDAVKKAETHATPGTTSEGASSVPKDESLRGAEEPERLIPLGYSHESGKTDAFSFPEENVEEPTYRFYSSFD